MPVFRRKIYEKMVQWKEEKSGSTALMIEGARRVGKSTIVEQFAKENYRSYIMIDFSEVGDEIKSIFSVFSRNKDLFFSRLQLFTNTRLYERDSLIIFDEVQRFPRAREMIKFLVKDGRYDYMETGSLISLIENTRNIQIPSEEESISMYPMDFEEFLWAMEKDQIPVLRELYLNNESLGASAHDVMMDDFRAFMVIGGMPQAVSTYKETKDLMKVESVKRMILDLYRSDILKIKKESTRMNALALFNNLPSLLSSPNKVFLPGKIKKGSKTKQYRYALEWLELAKIFNKCIETNDPSVALRLNDGDSFKCYLLDTGLLISLAFGKSDNTLRAAYESLLKGDLGINEGMFFENVVAQELVSSGRELVFYRKKKDDNRYYEVDFILRGADGLVPVEIKSGRSGRHRSLDVFSELYKSRIEQTIVIHTKDLETRGGIRYIPAYMVEFL